MRSPQLSLSLKTLWLSAAITAIPLVQPLRALGEIYNCGGVWTNTPCPGAADQMLPEISRAVRAPASPRSEDSASTSQEPLAPRYSLVRKLKKLNREYLDRGSNGLNKTEIDGFESFCLDRSHPFVDCQSLFDEHSKRLRELEIAKESNDLLAERNEIEQRKLYNMGSR